MHNRSESTITCLVESEARHATLLEVEDLRLSFGGVAAVDGVSFAVAEGAITALIGPNGAGKTTLFNLVSGFLHPHEGRIRFTGRRIDGLRADAVARAGLVRTFQTPRVLTRMRVLDNLMLAAREQAGERFAMRWIAPPTRRKRKGENPSSDQL